MGPGTTPIKFLTGTQKDVKLVPGLRGTGLRVKPGLSFQYLTRESFSLREGTIAFWMKPIGWSGLSRGRNFLSVRSDRVDLHFYIYPGQLYYYIAGLGRARHRGGELPERLGQLGLGHLEFAVPGA